MEMGLNYFCLRYYDPQIGRFMTLDPVDQKGMSPYAYCFNNPLISLDPTGAAREGYVTPIRPRQGHASGGGRLPYGWALVHHTEEEDLWHDQVMEYWSYKAWEFTGWGDWRNRGSMESYLCANPVLFAELWEKEDISRIHWYFIKNDYFRITETKPGERITTEYFFNPITMGIGMNVITELLGWELALSLVDISIADQMVTDAKAAFGPPTVLRVSSALYADIADEPGLIVDEIFWTVVTLGVQTSVSGGFPIGLKAMYHGPHHIFDGLPMKHYQLQIWLRHIGGITYRYPLWP